MLAGELIAVRLWTAFHRTRSAAKRTSWSACATDSSTPSPAAPASTSGGASSDSASGRELARATCLRQALQVDQQQRDRRRRDSRDPGRLPHRLRPLMLEFLPDLDRQPPYRVVVDVGGNPRGLVRLVPRDLFFLARDVASVLHGDLDLLRDDRITRGGLAERPPLDVPKRDERAIGNRRSAEQVGERVLSLYA